MEMFAALLLAPNGRVLCQNKDIQRLAGRNGCSRRMPPQKLHVSTARNCTLMWRLVATHWKTNTSFPCITVHTQVLAPQRFYANGSFQSLLDDVTSIHQASVSRIITGLTEVLCRKGLREAKIPSGLRSITETVHVSPHE